MYDKIPLSMYLNVYFNEYNFTAKFYNAFGWFSFVKVKISSFFIAYGAIFQRIVDEPIKNLFEFYSGANSSQINKF
jgi:hypothetical protein